MAGEDVGGARQACAAHFRAAIPALLAAWRQAVKDDPRLTTGTTLPRAALEDHVPAWLESLADVLAAGPGERRAADSAEAEDAEAHGLQRWQQGYVLHEVTREWGCLHRCVVAEFERIATAHPELPGAALTEARLKLADRITAATTASAEKYFRLERIEAAGNVHDLERALADVRELEVQRAQLWQQAAHDLRGNLGVVSNVAQGLAFRGLPAERVTTFLSMLRNNVRALHHLLDDVTALARLHAGQEQRHVDSFDAADVLRRLVDDVRSLADAKGLSLQTDGPVALNVEGDAVKTRRIAQNLLLNALKYTRSGGVVVSWSESASGDRKRWSFSIEDTGPGFHAGPGAPIVNALQPADDAASTPALPEVPDANVPPPGDNDPRPVVQTPGEGLGLAIVKRLCDLLDASLEIETVADRGTIARVFLPQRYE
jgi:signal transduction histidine kinase